MPLSISKIENDRTPGGRDPLQYCCRAACVAVLNAHEVEANGSMPVDGAEGLRNLIRINRIDPKEALKRHIQMRPAEAGLMEQFYPGVSQHQDERLDRLERLVRQQEEALRKVEEENQYLRGEHVDQVGSESQQATRPLDDFSIRELRTHAKNLGVKQGIGESKVTLREKITARLEELELNGIQPSAANG